MIIDLTQFKHKTTQDEFGRRIQRNEEIIRRWLEMTPPEEQIKYFELVYRKHEQEA